MMTEIRVHDLQFTKTETAAFLKRAVGCSVGSSALKHLQDKTEGWPVALRRAALALQHRSDADEFIRGFAGNSRQLQEYLVAGILAHQSPDVRDCMCRTSILDRFCAPLCQSLCDMKRGSEKQPLRDRTADQVFLGASLFCIPLDDRQEWYRYHHLFQELLQRYLAEHCDPREIATLDERAANWFEEQGLLDEAVQHALKGNDRAEAGGLIGRHQNEILSEEQWHRLNQWLCWLTKTLALAMCAVAMVAGLDLAESRASVGTMEVSDGGKTGIIGGKKQTTDRKCLLWKHLRAVFFWSGGHGIRTRNPIRGAAFRMRLLAIRLPSGDVTSTPFNSSGVLNSRASMDLLFASPFTRYFSVASGCARIQGHRRFFTRRSANQRR